MRLYSHYCPSGFSNCYILGTDLPDAPPSEMAPPHREVSLQREALSPREASLPREAIIIDPGEMDVNILNLIEDSDYTLKGVLITHDHPHHVKGLATIMRIYTAGIYSINPVIRDHRTTLVRDGDVVNIGSFRIEVISIPGHSADSAVFKIGWLLFTGDVLTAGLVGSTVSSYASATQASALRSKILSLPGDDYIILPGHGPPSSLEAERRLNLDLNSFDQRKNHHQLLDLETSI